MANPRLQPPKNKSDRLRFMHDVQLKAFQACMHTLIDSTNTRYDTFVKDMTRELAELKASIQFLQTELNAFIDNYKSENIRVKHDHRSLEKLIADFTILDDTMDYIENQSNV